MRMKRVNLFILSIFLLGFIACNVDVSSELPVFTTTTEFSNSNMSFLENADTVKIPIILSNFVKNDVEVSVEVYLETRDTTAVEGVHFTFPIKNITIPAGASIIQLPMVINNDTIVNVNRSFRLQISEITGAEPARISQLARVVIENEDFWPEIQFTKPRNFVQEDADGIWIKYEVTGILYQPMLVNLKFEDETALAGRDYVLPATTSFSFDDAKKDSIWIEINPNKKDFIEDCSFNMAWDITSAGLYSKNRTTVVNILDVKRAIVSFAKNDLIILEPGGPSDSKRIEIPLEFSNTFQRDIAVEVQIKSGLASGYTWVTQELNTNIDTVLYAVLEIDKGVDIAGPIEFTLTGSPTVDIDAGVATTREVDTLIGKQEGWIISSFSSEQPGDGGAQSGVSGALIDGDEATYWQSAWSSYGPPPHYVIIDMGANYEINMIDLYIREANHVASAIVEVCKELPSLPSSDWNALNSYTYVYPNSVYSAKSYSQTTVVGRYLKVTSISVDGGLYGNGREIYVHGRKLEEKLE